MSTTTIRLSEEMKVRLAAAAERAGTTSHNFILQAIAEKTEMDERNADFNSVADQRYADIVATGKTVSWSDMKAYLAKRIAGESARKPTAKKRKPE